jgi:HEAT repeat protein
MLWPMLLLSVVEQRLVGSCRSSSCAYRSPEMKAYPKGRVLILLGLMVMSLLGALAVRVCQPGLVRHQLNQLEVESRTAVVPISKLGLKAVPILLQEVRAEYSLPRRFYRSAWTNLPALGKRWLPSPAPVDVNLILGTSEALSLLGPPTLPRLVAALIDANTQVRLTVLDAIGRMGPTASGAIPDLIMLLHDPNAEVRYDAVSALEAMGPKNRQAIPDLITILQDDDVGSQPGMVVYVREHAAQLLGEMRSDAQTAVPSLRPMLNDAHPYAREQAALALWRITGDTNLVPALVAEFEQAADAQTRQRVLTIFEEMGPGAKEAAPVILAASKYADIAVREQATDFLEQLRSDAQSIVPKLRELLNDAEPYERGRAAFLLWRITGETNVLPVLIRELQQVSEIYTGRRILTALAEMGPAAKVAIPVLLEVLKESDTKYAFENHYNRDGDLVVIDIKENASQVLGRLGPDARIAVPELRRLLSSGRPWRRDQAAMALWRIDHDTNVVSILIRELQRVDRRQFEACGMCSRMVTALGEMGDAAKPAGPILVNIMKDSGWGTAPDAARAKLLNSAREALAKIDSGALARLDATQTQ